MSHNVHTQVQSRWPEELRLSQLFSDALRLRVLVECNAREMSPQSFHELVGGGTLAKVSQAFELLVQYDWLVWTRSDEADPEAVERFYRGTGVPIVSDELFEKLPDSTKALIFARIFAALTARTREAMKAGTICARAETRVTWTPLELDQQGWEALTARLDSVFRALPEEQERARARTKESGEEPIPMTIALLGFESPKEPERKFS